MWGPGGAREQVLRSIVEQCKVQTKCVECLVRFRHLATLFARSWRLCATSEKRPAAAMASERLRDAAPMPTDDDPPSALWCLFAASLPAVPFCCFLHPSALLWWFPVWVAVFYLPMPAMLQDGPKNFMLCTLAVYWSAHADGWSTPRALLGTVAMAPLMNLTHQALWDAAEPLLIGNPNHGRGRVIEHKMKSS